MKIKIFGKLTDIFGNEEYELEKGDIENVSLLRLVLEKNIPQLSGMTYIVVVDREKADEKTKIFESSEIALLPPYSGG